MKLSAQDTTALGTILAVCQVAGIETIIIENGQVRGASEARTAAIISDHAVPRFSQKIGLGRLGALKQRMDLLAGSTITIDAKESDRGEISSLEITSGRSRAQFRCTSTSLIKAPKQINGEVVQRVCLNRAEIKMVLDAVRVMGAKRVALCLRPDGAASFEFADTTNDQFRVELESAAEQIEHVESSTVNYYPADVFASVLRASSADGLDYVRVDVTDIGCVRLPINGHVITLLPQINEEDE